MEFHAVKLGTSGGNMVYSVFNSPIDLTYVNKLVIEYSVYMPGSASTWIEAYVTREKNTRYQAVKNLSIASKSEEITKKGMKYGQKSMVRVYKKRHIRNS